ncbi:MAG: DUF309 domain-containing protein [Bacteroidota bacterium]
MIRYCSSKAFPPYSFIHGLNVNPNKPGGYRQHLNDPVAEPINFESFFESKEYLFAIDLINHGYYWESHVYFEAIWNAHLRVGPIANYCKALVKIAAGAIKYEQNKKESANRLFNGASDIFNRLPNSFFLGITIDNLVQLTEKWKTEGQQFIDLRF